MEHNPEVKRICAEEYLNYIRSLTIRTQTLQSQIDQQRALLEPSGIAYSEGVSSSPATDTLEQGVIALNGLIAEYCTQLAEYVEQQRIAYKVLSDLPKPEHSQALIAYYVQGKTWEEVCVMMGYSWHGMMKLRRRAVVSVYDFMPEEYRRYTIPKAEVI